VHVITFDRDSTGNKQNGETVNGVAGVSSSVHRFAFDVSPYTAPRSAYNELFHSSLDKLIQSALHGKLFRSRQEEEGVAGRSMAWKVEQSIYS
jgi:hypothetical protein